MFLLLLACFGGTEYPPPDPLPAEYTACEVDEDCEVVQLGCCDHCNGGEAVAVNSGSVEAAQEAYSERCKRNFGCTLMACYPLHGICSADGACETEQDTGF